MVECRKLVSKHVPGVFYPFYITDSVLRPFQVENILSSNSEKIGIQLREQFKFTSRPVHSISHNCSIYIIIFNTERYNLVLNTKSPRDFNRVNFPMTAPNFVFKMNLMSYYLKNLVWENLNNEDYWKGYACNNKSVTLHFGRSKTSSEHGTTLKVFPFKIASS